MPLDTEPNLGGLAGQAAGPAWASPAVGVDSSAFRTGKRDVEDFRKSLGQLFKDIEGFVTGKGKQFQDVVSSFGRTGGRGSTAFRSGMGHSGSPLPAYNAGGIWGPLQDMNRQELDRVRPTPGQGQMFGTARYNAGYQPPAPPRSWQQQSMFGPPGPSGGQTTTERIREMGAQAYAGLSAAGSRVLGGINRLAPLANIGTAVGLDVAAAQVQSAGMGYRQGAFQLAGTTLSPIGSRAAIERTLATMPGARGSADAVMAAQLTQASFGRPFNPAMMRNANLITQMSGSAMTATQGAQAAAGLVDPTTMWRLSMMVPGIGRYGPENVPDINRVGLGLAQRAYGSRFNRLSRADQLKAVESPTGAFQGQMTYMGLSQPLQDAVRTAMREYVQLGDRPFTNAPGQAGRLGLTQTPAYITQQLTKQFNVLKDDLAKGLLPVVLGFTKALTFVMKPLNLIFEKIPGLADATGKLLVGFAGLETFLVGKKIVEKLMLQLGSLTKVTAAQQAVTVTDIAATEADTDAKVTDAVATGGKGILGKLKNLGRGAGGLITRGGELGGLGGIAAGGAGVVAGSFGEKLGGAAVGGHGAGHTAARVGGGVLAGIAGGAVTGGLAGAIGGAGVFSVPAAIGGGIIGGIAGGVGALLGDAPTAGPGGTYPSFRGTNALSQQPLAAGDQVNGITYSSSAGAGAATVTNLQPQILGRLQAMFKANPRLVLNSGWRSSQQQAALYQAYLSNRGPLAAPPGRSMHEKGLAADLGPPDQYSWLTANAPKFGLHRTVVGPGGEMWHYEPVGAAQGLGTPAQSNPDPNQPGGGASFLPAGYAKMDMRSKLSALAGVVASMGSSTGAGTSPGGVGPGGAPAGGVSGTGGPPGIDAFMQAIRKEESGGNYAWVSNAAGATGAYQILMSNWPSWAKQAGVNPADHSQAAQDAVARHMFTQYYNQYGHSWFNVAEAWYGGGGAVGHPNIGGGPGYPTVGQYATTVMGVYHSYGGVGDAPTGASGGVGAVPMMTPVARAPATFAGSSPSFSTSSRSVHIEHLTIPLGPFTQPVTPEYIERMAHRILAVLKADDTFEMAG